MPTRTKPTAESTQDVLGMMTAHITGRKTQAAARLTPTGSEVTRTHVLPKTDAPFPNDQPQEVVEQKIVELERIIAQLQDAVAALRTLAGKDAEAPVDLAAERKVRERAADEAHATRVAEANEAIAQADTVDDAVEVVARFNRNFKAQQEVAQAATFTQPAAPEEKGWTCPQHGKFVIRLSSKKREFRGCPECTQFERLSIALAPGTSPE